jgi:hypothetical protein
LTPHVHVGDTPFGIWWRRWVGTIALVAVLIAGAIGFARIESEANTREKQFCGLVVNGIEEQYTRIAMTKKFLATPNSKLRQGLVDLKGYIRNISLPQTVNEFESAQDSLPSVCEKYYEGVN